MTSMFKSIGHVLLMTLAVIWVYLTFFYRGTLTVLFLIFLMVAIPTLLRAEGSYPEEWTEDYPLRASELTLFDAFDIFSRSYGVGVVLERDIEDEDLRATPGTMSVTEYLDDITGQASLGWYFDGSIVRVFSVGMIETRVLPVKSTRASKIVDTLKDLEIYQPQFTHRVGRQSQALRVTAPPSYIEMVASTLDAIENSRQLDVRVRRAGVVIDFNDVPDDSSVELDEPVETDTAESTN